MSGMAVLENVRRYRTIASLCRQTATFRPVQKSTLLEQAFEWERLAMASLKHTLRFAMGNRCPCLKSGKRWQRQTLANKTSATFEGFTLLPFWGTARHRAAERKSSAIRWRKRTSGCH